MALKAFAFRDYITAIQDDGFEVNEKDMIVDKTV